MECWLLPTSDPGWPNVVAIDDQGLVMSFRRTIRVPETETVSTPLPDLGAFPLYAVDQFKDKLPDDVSSKGGLFFPMHQREAMWIRLLSKRQFAAKFYVDGVNAVSGLPANETTATKLHRQKRKADGESVQDYAVTPQQRWLDGIAAAEGKFRQLAAPSAGLAYTVEAQVVAENAITGPKTEEVTKKEAILQDEIYVEFPKGTKTALLVDLEMNLEDFRELVRERFCLDEYGCILKFQGKRSKGETVRECGIGRGDTVQIVPPGSTMGPDQSRFRITVTTLSRRVIPLEVCSQMEFIEVKELLQEKENAPADDLRLIYHGKGLMDHWKLKELDVKKDSNLHMVKRLKPKVYPLNSEAAAYLEISAEGLTHQSIQPDTYHTESWDRASTRSFNINILEASLFQSVTGVPPPESPIDETTYANIGIPFYELLGENLSEVKGLDERDRKQNTLHEYSWNEFSEIKPTRADRSSKISFRTVSEIERGLESVSQEEVLGPTSAQAAPVTIDVQNEAGKDTRPETESKSSCVIQ